MGKTAATGFLVLVPKISYSGTYVHSIRIDRVRTSKPSLAPGEIAVKVKLNFDDAAIISAIPTIELDVQSFISPSAPAAPESVEVTA